MARKAAVRRGRKNNDRPEQQTSVTTAAEAQPAGPVPEAPGTEQTAAQPAPEAPEEEPVTAQPAPVSNDTEPMRIPVYLQEKTAQTPAESDIDTIDRLQRDADAIAQRRYAEEVQRRRAEDKQRSADEAAYRRQAEEEAREREEIEERRRKVEEEQRRIRQRVEREVEERTAAEERRLRREQEARIEEEVEKRLRQAEEEAVPQIIFSPKMERAKRATVLWIVAGVVILALVSILLGIRNDRLRRQLAEQALAESTAESVSGDAAENSNAAQSATGEAAGAQAAQGTRSVYLTFDDGPSPVTEQVLDILKQYDVKATFFVVGRVDEASGNIYRRIVDEGHTLAMHSYTHNYAQIYESLDSFQADMHKLQNLLYEETGVWCKVFRFPGGSSNAASRVDMDELTAYLDREEITYYDWNVYGGDDISPDIMQSNVFANVEKYDNAVILLHDASDKEETVEALPGIIEYIQGLDRTVMLPITDETIPVQHGGETPDQ